MKEYTPEGTEGAFPTDNAKMAGTGGPIHNLRVKGGDVGRDNEGNAQEMLADSLRNKSPYGTRIIS